MAPLDPFPGLTCAKGQISGAGRADLGWMNSRAQVNRALKAWDDRAGRGLEQRAKAGGERARGSPWKQPEMEGTEAAAATQALREGWIRV